MSPINHLATTDGVSFAPLGLVNMYNSGGAVEGLRYDGEKMKVVMEVKGCGKFGAYSSVKPSRCVVESSEIAFEYDVSSGLVTLCWTRCLQRPRDYMWSKFSYENLSL